MDYTFKAGNHFQKCDLKTHMIFGQFVFISAGNCQKSLDLRSHTPMAMATNMDGRPMVENSMLVVTC